MRGSLPRPIRHGTPGGARTHYRRGERPCDSCRVAGNRRKAELVGYDPYSPNLMPAVQAPPLNGVPVVPYQWRARAYPWAVAALRRAEAVYGTPTDAEAVQEAAS